MSFDDLLKRVASIFGRDPLVERLNETVVRLSYQNHKGDRLFYILVQSKPGEDRYRVSKVSEVLIGRDLVALNDFATT
jgi:hypothetical protein